MPFDGDPMTVTRPVDTFAADRLPPADQQPVFLFDRPELSYPPRLNAAAALIDAHVAAGRGGRRAV